MNGATDHPGSLFFLRGAQVVPLSVVVLNTAVNNEGISLKKISDDNGWIDHG
jgi:hypothetical protein